MGQGYSLTTLSAGSAGIDVPELAELSYEKALGDARFMKTVRARHLNGLVVVKVVMKPYNTNFKPYIEKIMRERKLLESIPNALAYHRAFETTNNGFLIRQYTYSSIYDRMSTRPFLEDVEKRWLAFQLLCAVRDCHEKDLYHGDIKTENILVTSWNWLLLSDFSSSFKPVNLPEDDPADFSFFFDISARRTCYVAPERFLSSGEKPGPDKELSWATDIFSVGCVIAELFLETPIFNLEQMLKYRQGQYDPLTAHVNRIEDVEVREIVAHMIQLEPNSRYQAVEYLNFWRQRAFPEYFSSFLHQYMQLITDPSSGRSPMSAGSQNLGESDDRIDRVYNDYDKIAYFLGYDNDSVIVDREDESSKPSDSVFPLHVSLPYKRKLATRKTKPAQSDGTLLFLNIITSSIRSTARAEARVKACELLLSFAERISDEAKLDRAIPFVVSLLDDKSDLVKSAAIRSLTQLLVLVAAASPANASLFPEYIIPRLQDVANPRKGPKPSSIVRITYAECMGSLSDTALRFLGSIQALRAEGSLPGSHIDADEGASVHSYKEMYEVAKAELTRFFESQTTSLITDSNGDVRRAFLDSVPNLCIFFGTSKASDVILSHLNTYLNDKDWRLKSAFFDTILGVATLVGGSTVEEFILPLMIQALADTEEFVVEKVLGTLATIAELGLFERATLWELIDLVSRFTMHPNTWIRESAAHFLSASTKYLAPSDCECLVKPIVRIFLKLPLTSWDESNILECLKPSLSRNVYELMLTWAIKVDKGTFWNPYQMPSRSEGPPGFITSKELSTHSMGRIPKNEEDKQWLSRIHNAGLDPSDDFKIVALREYVLRAAKKRALERNNKGASKTDKIINLGEMSVPLTNVIFDQEQKHLDREDNMALYEEEDDGAPQTISDALLDASTTIGTEGRQDSTSSQAQPSSARSRHARDSSAVANMRSPLSTSPQNFDSIDIPRQDSKQSSLASSPKSNTAAGSKNTSNLGRHRSTALDLIQGRQASGKAIAETSTTPDSVAGKIDNSSRRGSDSSRTQLSSANDDRKRDPNRIRYNGAHNYQGRDPTVLRLLDSVYLEHYPIDESEFGPSVIPAEHRRINDKAERPSDPRWKPDGTVVGVFAEHTAAITRVIASPDHLFFITASDDGSVKIWDTSRLERNLAHRARLTHRHSTGARLTSICFVENTHTFISCASDGNINVVKVECTETTQQSQVTTKYGKCRVLRNWSLPDDDSFVVWSEHYRAETQSLLIVVTNTCKIHAIDLRTMETLYTLENPIHHGTPTCFTLDSEHYWLLLSTDHGIIDLWDLRFHVRVRSWGLLGASPITRVAMYPIRARNTVRSIASRKKQVMVCGGTCSGDVTVWDLEKLACKEVYRTAAAGRYHRAQAAKDISYNPYVHWSPDKEMPTAMLRRLAINADADGLMCKINSNISIHAICSGARTHHYTDHGRLEPRHGFFVTAGGGGLLASSKADTTTSQQSNTNGNGNSENTQKDTLANQGVNKLRFWDLDRPEESSVFSGLEAVESSPRFEICKDEAGTRGDVTVWEEIDLSPAEPASNSSATSRGKKANEGRRRTGDYVEIPGNKEKAASAGSRSNTVVSLQQQRLLKSHLDVVSDVCFISRPFDMVVSVDRSGVVFVYS